MSLSYELSKIRDGFSKVKQDMVFLSKEITSNYDNFVKEHKTLTNDVARVTNSLQEQINRIRTHHIHNSSTISNKEIEDLKVEIKTLKKEVSLTNKEHENLTKIIDDVKKERKDIKQLKEKLHSSELEIFLLKERLSEKDVEIKNIKDVNRKMFDIINELSNVELEMLNLSNKRK